MKKLALTFALVVSLVSCSSDDDSTSNQEPTGCKCDKVYEKNTLTYNQTTGATSQTGWILINNSYPNFTTDCSKNGEVSSQQTQSNGQITVMTRLRIICR